MATSADGAAPQLKACLSVLVVSRSDPRAADAEAAIKGGAAAAADGAALQLEARVSVLVARSDKRADHAAMRGGD